MVIVEGEACAEPPGDVLEVGKVHVGECQRTGS